MIIFIHVLQGFTYRKLKYFRGWNRLQGSVISQCRSRNLSNIMKKNTSWLPPQIEASEGLIGAVDGQLQSIWNQNCIMYYSIEMHGGNELGHIHCFKYDSLNYIHCGVNILSNWTFENNAEFSTDVSQREAVFFWSYIL